MEYRQLGTSGEKVSLICLGTMTWGNQNTQEEGFEQMDYALSQGVNFFDTAEMYAIPPSPETSYKTETIIGNWFAQRGTRGDVFLATKVSGRTNSEWIRGGSVLNADNINQAVDASLERLQTDYIDLYQVHWPDRRLSLFGAGSPGYRHYEAEAIEIAETLEALDGLVRSGKVRYIGLSNETPWGLSEYLRLSDLNGWARVQSVQNVYSLVARSYEFGMSEFAYRSGVGLLAYSPLAQGYLTGKYRGGALPEGSRKQMFQRLGRYETPQAQQAIERCLRLADDSGLNPATMALAFVNRQSFVHANIIGATTMEQLKLAIASWEVKLPEDVLEGIEEIFRDCPAAAH
ncbi:MAG: aldo/keto reductase [Gammaproteobacteria bacterium AqS3]|nr:aldo/keto reductase [Gammaproteobacteria bacterium AqS3]